MASKKEKELIKINVEELKDFLTHIIQNNRFLQTKNKIPVAIEIVGDSGIGKTSSIIQLKEELGLNHLIKLNLAQIEELGDLVGFPIRQFEMKKDKELLWIDEHAFNEYKELGFDSTGRNRMSYCPPEWISGKGEGGILLLDDWNRADMRFVQAVMELIDRQQYLSWKLPKDWHIVLTSNPDDGDYLVQSIDNAQKTRFISVKVKFDIKCWSKWAEKEGLDNRCINFLLLHPELVTKEINARSSVMFFNSISSLDDFEKSLSLIQMIGEGSVGADFSTMFSLFINNKLDKIIPPTDIMFKDKELIIKTLKGMIGVGEKYRSDIASILVHRLINCTYSLLKTDPSKIDKAYIDRIADLVTNDIFAVDLRFMLVKQIWALDKDKFKTMTLNNKLLGYIIK